jgi:hypothetical protein
MDYHLNKARIAELYCVNKARPQLQCNGKCHLVQQLRKAEGGNKKGPAGALAKVKYEVLPAASISLRTPSSSPVARDHYAPTSVAKLVAGRCPGVFRPPLFVA